MAVQAHQYGANVMLIPAEGHGNRARGPQYDVVDHRGFVPAGASQHNAHNNNVFLGKNAFQIPPSVNMNGANQYHLFNQLASGRQGYAGQYQQIDGTAFMIGTEKQQIHAANAMMGSRKRTREQIEEFCTPWANAVAAPQQFVINGVTQLDTHPGSVVNPQSTNGISTGLRLTFEDDRLRSASPVSTTGPIEAVPKPVWVENFASHLQQERDEVAHLLKIQNEQLRTFIDAKRQRHTHQLIAAAEEGFARKLREKETEMDKVRRQNQELMDRFTQLNAESQHWQTKVRNTEAMVNMLRANLAQAAAAQAERQQQHTIAAQYHHQLQHPGMKEGCGDSDAVDDCASSYIDDINEAHMRARNENKELREQRTCRVCRCNDVSMLLLPCRHLCLCHDCEGQLLACPLCRTTKNASVQVYMS